MVMLMTSYHDYRKTFEVTTSTKPLRNGSSVTSLSATSLY